MTAYASTSHRRFTRNTDKALLGGVCAGFADYFGFNLRVTRLLLVVAFCVAMPITIIAYIAIVFLVPAESGKYGYVVEREVRYRRRRLSRKERRQAAEEDKRQATDEYNQRCRSLDERLARIERYVTSARYNLDSEIRNL
jgi:phage shock protein C